MLIAEKVKSFFQKRQPDLFCPLAELYFSRCPDARLVDVLPYLMEAGIKIFGVKPTTADYVALREYVSSRSVECDDQVLSETLNQILRRGQSADRTVLLALPEPIRMQVLQCLLETSPSCETNMLDAVVQVADGLGLSRECAEKMLADERARRQSLNVAAFSKAGLLVALSVIAILLVLAICMKSVFFGFLAAYLALPLERFYEEKVLQTKLIKAIDAFFFFVFARPVLAMKNHFQRRFPSQGEKSDLSEEIKKQKEEKQALRTLTVKASFLTLSTCIVVVVAVISLASYLLIPFLKQQGENIRGWVERQQENVVEKKVFVGQGAKGQVESQRSENAPVRKTFRQVLDDLRKSISNVDWVKEKLHDKDFVTNSKNVLIFLFKSVSSVGNLLFGVIVFLVSFFLFLQKMAYYRVRSMKKRGKQEGDAAAEISTWGLQVIFKSKWMPDIGEKSRREAIDIFTKILTMFDAWITGYFKIIVTEICLYIPVFLLFGVPYAIPLACMSCMTVLLPVIGITSCVTITTLVTLLCASEGSLVTALIGVALAYLLINAVLEQLILYPSLVGEGLGLTALETIFVVLLGAALAGIAGMILAVPVTALLKYLIPKCYPLLHKENAEVQTNVEEKSLS